MPADRDDLARRLAAAKDADTTRGLNFNALFALVRDELGDAAPREIDPARKGSRVDFFSYSMREYLQAAWDAVDRLEPRLGSIDAVWYELGRRTVSGFLSSVLGRAIFTIAGRDPRKLISAGPAGYRAAVSYGERKVEWLGERHGRLVFKRDFMPSTFHHGVVLTALQSTDARNPRVEAKDTGFLDSVYEITWDG
jgi:uncharacterized protein (TIGR02265 family)